MNDNDGKNGGLGYVGWDDTLAYYSNFGQKIDLAGVGTTYTTALVSKGGYGNQYEGTSLAGAHVSGAAALYIAGHSRAANAAGVTAIKQALLAVAEPQSA
jgi:subtilisin family serine protease